MDFEGLSTNAGDKRCNTKTARFTLKAGHLFVRIPHLSPLLPLFRQISPFYIFLVIVPAQTSAIFTYSSMKNRTSSD